MAKNYSNLHLPPYQEIIDAHGSDALVGLKRDEATGDQRTETLGRVLMMEEVMCPVPKDRRMDNTARAAYILDLLAAGNSLDISRYGIYLEPLFRAPDIA